MTGDIPVMLPAMALARRPPQPEQLPSLLPLLLPPWLCIRCCGFPDEAHQGDRRAATAAGLCGFTGVALVRHAVAGTDG
jgi:hypothetical protein